MELGRSYSCHHALLRIMHLIVLFSALCSAHQKLIKGKLEISLHHYYNYDASLEDGKSCDWWKPTNCDISFGIYVTSINHGDLLSYTQQDEYKSVNHVMFHDKIGISKPQTNPMKIDLSDVNLQKGRVELLINAVDRDDGGVTQRMDMFFAILATNPPKLNEQVLLYTPGKPVSYRKSYISFSYSIQCNDPNMYGPFCETSCIPQNSMDAGHYLCDHAGNKVCLPDWSDLAKDCKMPSLCSSRPCLNGGTCIELPRNNMFWCSCTKDFTGRLCNVMQCNRNDCLNGGTCIRQSSGTVGCTCPKGYEGDKCQTDTDRCKAYSPCGSASTCYAQPSGYTCACAPGVVGSNCDVDVDECSEKGGNPCTHGGTCVNNHGNFTCLCPPGLHGRLCESDINECQLKPPPCQRNQKCVNTLGGHVCHRIDVDDCVGVVCGGGGVCIDMPFKYYCQCQAGYSGVNCNYSVAEDFRRMLEAMGGGAAATTAGLAAFTMTVAMAAAAMAITLHPDGLL